MRLDFIDLGKLSVSKANMRYSKKAPDVSDILPTVRQRGVIVPILVRPISAANDETSDAFEIIAGARRFHAAGLVAEERREAGQDIEAMPCAILEAGDDADAIEASLIENSARLDPDEVTRWECFTRLVKEGRSVEQIALTFGLPDLGVKRILALGNLMPRIRDLYRKGEVDASTVRHLTMASKSQQRAWLALIDDDDAYVPTGHQLKGWLFGGASIAVKHAIFDTEGMTGIIADLFGEDRYFADSDAFWTAQGKAIEQRRAAYLDEGWSDVVSLQRGEQFCSWEFVRAPKRKGGRVYIEARHSGEVAFHAGYVTAKEARRLAKSEAAQHAQKPVRSEVSGTMQTYIDLHRHAALRAALLGHPGLTLRLMVAHAIAGSSLWIVRLEPQTARNHDTRESVKNSRGQAKFDEARRAALALMGFGPKDTTVAVGGYGLDSRLAVAFARLIELDDTQVLSVLAVVMGETLVSGRSIIEMLGQQIDMDMAPYWQADEAFFEALRDREVLLAMVEEVAGATIAKANAGEKTKVLKAIIRNHLDGADGREKRVGWVPRWMSFPPAAYTGRGGVGTVECAEQVARALAGDDGAGDDETDPDESEADDDLESGPESDPETDLEPGAPHQTGDDADDIPLAA
ncbi:ParB/RepB/Spo0J family partition protein [Novosphingobium terrae]|uniref:ParB/RepB/Spo0J family partition protein n=1 Tax=Novosphingobium terrae TaxID=2726189 RepID=UPI00197EA1E2|nr:ParB N-terminal domain-containing protein [Novosphingobium terrae]